MSFHIETKQLPKPYNCVTTENGLINFKIGYYLFLELTTSSLKKSSY